MPGVLVVVAALLAALFSFLVLIGQTPIEPNEKATLWLVAVNGFFIALLAGLIAREIYRIVMQKITDFRQALPQEDDMTLMVIKVTAEQKS